MDDAWWVSLAVGGGGAMVTYVAAVVLHELGHLVVGVGLGLDVMAVQVGPVAWVVDRVTGRGQVCRRPLIQGGFVLFTTHDVREPSWKLAGMISGGVIANLLTALLSGLALGVLGPSVVAEGYAIHVGVVLFQLLVMSMWVGLWAAIPWTYRGLASDGRYLWGAYRRDDVFRSLRNGLALTAHERHAASMTTLDTQGRAFLSRPHQSTQLKRTAAFLRYLLAVEEHAWDDARAAIEEAYEHAQGLHPLFSAPLIVHRGMAQACLDGDLSGASETLSSLHGWGVIEEAHFSAFRDAVEAQHSGDHDGCATALRQAWAKLDTSQWRARIPTYRMWHERLSRRG